jgi:hypothetical protein
MPSLDDVDAIASTLPDVTQEGRGERRTWFVRGKAFAWERPFSKADIRRYGDESPPDGPILAVRVLDLDEKDALLAVERPGFFTIPHFDGYAAVLIQLEVVDAVTLREAILTAWRGVAPRDLVRRRG